MFNKKKESRNNLDNKSKEKKDININININDDNINDDNINDDNINDDNINDDNINDDNINDDNINEYNSQYTKKSLFSDDLDLTDLEKEFEEFAQNLDNSEPLFDLDNKFDLDKKDNNNSISNLDKLKFEGFEELEDFIKSDVFTGFDEDFDSSDLVNSDYYSDSLDTIDISNFVDTNKFNDLDKRRNLNFNKDSYPKKEIDLKDLENINLEYPEIELETENIMMTLRLKKDYSKIDNLNERKKEFIKDLKDFIDEFDNTKESNELMKFYDIN